MTELKRVSFKVAKAIKEARYPQTHGMCYYIGVDEFRPMEISRQAYNCNEHISAPTYLEVWLWLWREKGIYIDIAHYYSSDEVTIWDNKYNKIKGIDCMGKYYDPEEAIIAAIEHLVTNNLIK